MDKDLVKLGVGGCLVFVGFAGLCAGGTLYLRHRARAAEAAEVGDDEAQKPAAQPTRASEPARPAHVTSSPAQVAAPAEPKRSITGDLEWSVPVHVRDRAHVEITELIPQALHLAHRLQPGAKFYGLDGWGLRHGTLDLDHLGSDGRVSFDFEFGGLDKSKPPGQDKVEVRIDVRLSPGGGELMGRASPHGAIHIHSEQAFGGPLPPAPGCTARRAFEAAVGSGVPENAIARLMYEDDRHFSKAFVWSLRVDGHDEYRREIDANSCAIVKNWGAKKRGR